jgi:CRISPR-associated protein Csm1
MERLGQRLPRAEWVTLDGDDNAALTTLDDVVGYRVALFDRTPHGGRRLALHAGRDAAAPLFLASTHIPVADERVAAESAARSNGEGEEPLRPGDPVTFTDVAHLSVDEGGQRVGLSMLGVLKADVDRLGLLMGYGLPADQVSFGRLAALSRSLDLFFKGFLDARIRERYPNVYTVFAGGDDLLLIGPWYDIVRFAGELRSWFGRHVCEHAGISLSAGVVFTKPTTPVRQLAALADAALDAAKDGGRRRVTLAGTTLEWPDFDEAWRLHRLMIGARADAKRHRQDLPPAFVYRLLGYAKSALRVQRGSGSVPLADVKWRAQLNYDVKRNYPRSDGDGQSPLKALRDELLKVDHTRAAALHAATMLTLYVMRGER